ncbi:MAG: hypothetical protein ACERKN_21695 [Velocimicrobium sp.]
MKRKGIITLVLIVALLSTGCGASQRELTQEENDMIAEYMAGLLLKYDYFYDAKLLYNTESDRKEADLTEDTSLQEFSSPSPEATKDSIVPEKENLAMAEATSEPEYQMVSELFKNEGCRVDYVDENEYQSFPKTSETSYFLLEANANKKLLVLSFDITNEASKKKNFSLIESGISYRLENSQGKSNKPLLTALTNDLQYIDIKIDAGKTKRAVIVFEIPEDAMTKGYVLYITNGDKTAKVVLNEKK